MMNRSRLQLPAPEADALAASTALQALIAAQIKVTGWLSFARFMELALYAPGLGYYSGGATKLGKSGDFTTAPEISPLFGATLAEFCLPIMQQSAPQIMEFGAGTGKLAHDILQHLQQQGQSPEKYWIVEVSGQLRAQQEQTLAAFPQVEWLEALPSSFHGVILGNEVLDAMPVHLVQKDAQGQAWQEMGVALDEHGQFAWQTQPCSAHLWAQLQAQIPHADQLPPGYLTELHPHAASFMHSVSGLLAQGQGAAVWLDYGFAADEYYLDQRRAGTLMCHYRHHAHAEPFYLPGLQDITSHVDFTLMAHQALAAGLDLLSYTNQAGFLLDAGMSRLLETLDPQDTSRYLPQVNAVGKLLAPHEMGELFKVLVAGKGVQLAEDWGRFGRQGRL